MKIKDHFLSQETFEIVASEIEGVLKTTPIPENLDKYYESASYISHHQDSNSLKEKIYKYFQSHNLAYKKKLLSSVLPKRSSVLDYGCGAGEFLKFIEEDFNTFGFEPSKVAQMHALEKLKNTELISDIRDLDDENLDAITLWHVFEHIEHQEEMMNLFHQKLKRKGMLFIAVPNPNSYDAKHYKEFWAAYDVPRHVFHFSQKGIQNLFESKNQWKLISTKPLYLDAFYISILSEKYKKSPLFWMKGVFSGAISNFKARKSTEFSSLVYLFEKK